MAASLLKIELHCCHVSVPVYITFLYVNMLSLMRCLHVTCTLVLSVIMHFPDSQKWQHRWASAPAGDRCDLTLEAGSSSRLSAEAACCQFAVLLLSGGGPT